MQQKTEITKDNIIEVLACLSLNHEDLKSRNPDEIWIEIRNAYKKCAIKYHPDKNKTPEAEEQFKDISHAYQLFFKAHESELFTWLFSAEPLINDATPKKAANTVTWSFPDSVKNSLYAYYEGRHGQASDLPGEANSKVRSMLTRILGISSFGFWVEFNNTNFGYIVKSSEQSTINVISEFLTIISEYALECIKPFAFHYEVTIEDAQVFCKTEKVDCDHITIAIKHAMKLENTSSIITIFNENDKKHQIYIHSLASVLIPAFPGKLVSGPSQIPQPALGIAVKTPLQAVVQKSKIQLAFALDVTSSMSSMLGAAKQSLREAGNNIQKTNNEAPDMFVVTYHDYNDEGAPIYTGDRFGRGGRGDTRFDGDASSDIGRFARGDTIARGRGADVAPEPLPEGETTIEAPKLLEALNYPGKRDEHKRPIFTSPDIVSNILDAVQAEGGGDLPEMLEAALAVSTQLPWTAPVRTLYIALDAPPHCHYNGLPSGDSFMTLDAIQKAQATLNNDPVLKNATAPEDWFTQILLLARQGVKINPMVCATSKDVIFMATFIATITGGSAFIINNNDWQKKLSSVIQDATLLDVKEANPMAIIAHTHVQEHSDMRPDNAFFAAIMNIMKSFDINKIFLKSCDITQLAAEVRSIYSNEITVFLKNNQKLDKTLPVGYLPMADDILKMVLNARNTVIINKPTPPALPTRSPLIAHSMFNEAEKDYELTKTKACVFFIFSSMEKASKFHGTHSQYISPIWEPQIQQHLPVIDSDRIEGKFVIRIPINSTRHVGRYGYQQFCNDTKLALPSIGDIKQETRSYQKPAAPADEEKCCIM